MAPEPEGDPKHIIQAVWAFWKTAVEGMTTIAEAAVGDNSERCSDTILENSMVCDVLIRSLVRTDFLLS